MKNRPQSDPIDPTPPMPRGSTEFEEKRIAADFIAVFHQISNALFHSIQESHEYAYRCGVVTGKSIKELDQAGVSPKYPNYIKIL